MQDACGVANPTGIHRHVDDLLLHRRRLPSITLVQQEGAPGTALLAAPVPLLSLTSLAMADDIGPLTVGTGQELENHDATRSRWECLTSETLIEDSISTSLRHLHLDLAELHNALVLHGTRTVLQRDPPTRELAVLATVNGLLPVEDHRELRALGRDL